MTPSPKPLDTLRLRRWLAGQTDLVVSPILLDELHEELQPPKFGQWLGPRKPASTDVQPT